MQQALSNIWGHPQGFRIDEVGEKTFQLFFDNTRDMRKALEGSPWLHRNTWLSLQQWVRGSEVDENKFLNVKVWCQLWGLPPHCKTKRMGEKVGRMLGQVQETTLVEIPNVKGSILKVLVVINVKQALKAGCNVGSKADGAFWVDFKYERLPQCCYYCGRVGHDERDCDVKGKEEEEGRQTTHKLGPWIRATNSGRRIEDRAEFRKENEGEDEQGKPHNNQPKLISSEALLTKMGLLTVREEEKLELEQTLEQHTEQNLESERSELEVVIQQISSLGNTQSPPKGDSITDKEANNNTGAAQPVTLAPQVNEAKRKTWKRVNRELTTRQGKGEGGESQQVGEKRSMEIDGIGEELEPMGKKKVWG